jgi:hypothetical protein
MMTLKKDPKVRNQHLQLVLHEIEAVGGVIDRIDHRRHWVVYWTVHGRKLIYVTPVTSASVRGTWKAVSDIRRYARSAAA